MTQGIAWVEQASGEASGEASGQASEPRSHSLFASGAVAFVQGFAHLIVYELNQSVHT